ncbi:hypothetical protein NDU88_002292 [Pleurodeles waltl]|uniref:Uncharacterized protein n=1 Tax=Pleurodeles waltl TaxID=8319 RepID=A0AAV7KSA5_PLEWA|nr:hypothetical protein NDU88_002292 [Pleurodeles waltl]
MLLRHGRPLSSGADWSPYLFIPCVSVDPQLGPNQFFTPLGGHLLLQPLRHGRHLVLFTPHGVGARPRPLRPPDNQLWALDDASPPRACRIQRVPRTLGLPRSCLGAPGGRYLSCRSSGCRGAPPEASSSPRVPGGQGGPPTPPPLGARFLPQCHRSGSRSRSVSTQAADRHKPAADRSTAPAPGTRECRPQTQGSVAPPGNATSAARPPVTEVLLQKPSVPHELQGGRADLSPRLR